LYKSSVFKPLKLQRLSRKVPKEEPLRARAPPPPVAS